MRLVFWGESMWSRAYLFHSNSPEAVLTYSRWRNSPWHKRLLLRGWSFLCIFLSSHFMEHILSKFHQSLPLSKMNLWHQCPSSLDPRFESPNFVFSRMPCSFPPVIWDAAPLKPVFGNGVAWADFALTFFVYCFQLRVNSKMVKTVALPFLGNRHSCCF